MHNYTWSFLIWELLRWNVTLVNNINHLCILCQTYITCSPFFHCSKTHISSIYSTSIQTLHYFKHSKGELATAGHCVVLTVSCFIAFTELSSASTGSMRCNSQNSVFHQGVDELEFTSYCPFSVPMGHVLPPPNSYTGRLSLISGRYSLPRYASLSCSSELLQVNQSLYFPQYLLPFKSVLGI